MFETPSVSDPIGASDHVSAPSRVGDLLASGWRMSGRAGMPSHFFSGCKAGDSWELREAKWKIHMQHEFGDPFGDEYGTLIPFIYIYIYPYICMDI